MAKLHQLKTFSSEKGNLTILENVLPGTIQRVFYIYSAGNAQRAGHRHVKTWGALVCLAGSCRVYSHDGQVEKFHYLDSPDQCLVLEPQDWHLMDHFSDDAILLVVANQPYDQADYIAEPYPTSRFAAVPA
ncbi:WxcM-like domain-containing protein [Rudanella paleaurantiibacter]|uniref:WxcM-like domain-containing protein n=1 Tax=Rudanella paleaurantiibacter TaxID=2614655 RepID=A0A7J5TZ99_9BACT|nr:FdtA/QdtA family cupin domain-containing protein [Rudanella paleaurantiibacter]KAB7730381.1 WxcM-like domain-containing protein [Rudanella paleaurantiibacter]